MTHAREGRPEGLADRYARITMGRLEHLLASQRLAIEAAGAAIAAALASEGRVWITQTSHTLHLEGTGRAGGFVAVHVLEDVAAVGPRDVVIAGTTAGVFASIVDAAMVARARGATVVALIQLAHELDPVLVADHPSGRRLHEVADIVVDLGGRLGDGEIDLDDTGIAILPSSGVTGVFALWMILAVATDALLAEGRIPLVLQSNLEPGARAGNELRIARHVAEGAGSISRGDR